MNILVTGGYGFIGSHFIKYILCNNNPSEFTLYNIDALRYGSNRDNLTEVQNDPRLHFIEADINHISKLEDKLPKPDIVINFAAESHVDRSISDPSPFIWSNFQGAFELLEYVRKNDISKYLQISTDEVYGEASQGLSFKESDSLNPSNPYSASKAAAELLVESYSKTYGLNVLITRCTNNFGPHQFPEKIIPKTIIRILEGNSVFLYGDGKQIRDWIYVTDHVRAVFNVMEKGRFGEVYNISSSNPMTNIHIVNEISEILRKKVGKTAQIRFTEDRPGHDMRYSLDSTKISSELDWNPIVGFHDGLVQTVNWYIENRKWWLPLLDETLMSPQPWKAISSRSNNG